MSAVDQSPNRLLLSSINVNCVPSKLLGSTRYALETASMLIISLSVIGSVLAQSSVSPELIARFNSMSPEEQRALAQQYGASIQDLRAITQHGSRSVLMKQGLGLASETLKPQETVAEEGPSRRDQLDRSEEPPKVEESPDSSRSKAS